MANTLTLTVNLDVSCPNMRADWILAHMQTVDAALGNFKKAKAGMFSREAAINGIFTSENISAPACSGDHVFRAATFAGEAQTDDRLAFIGSVVPRLKEELEKVGYTTTLVESSEPSPHNYNLKIVLTRQPGF